MQKQLCRGVLRKGFLCILRTFCKTRRKTPVPKSVFKFSFVPNSREAESGMNKMHQGENYRDFLKRGGVILLK